MLTQLIEKETLAQVFSFEFCEISKNTFVTEHLRTTALYISSSRNKVADKESRKLRDNLEWSLEGKFFRKIVGKFGPVTIDLLASRVNCKVHLYYS